MTLIASAPEFAAAFRKWTCAVCDYVDDEAMFMFTAQQVLRMQATLEGPRSGLR